MDAVRPDHDVCWGWAFSLEPIWPHQGIDDIDVDIDVYFLIFFLSVQCCAWTEYKFTYVCVSVCVCLSHFLSTRLQVRPLNGFLQLIA